MNTYRRPDEETDVLDLSEHAASSCPAPEIELMNAARHNLTELMRASPRPPASLIVRVGNIAIEATWPSGDLDAHQPTRGPGGTVIPLPVTAAVPPAPEENDNAAYIRAEVVGSFYVAPKPGDEPFVKVGDTVSIGQQVAIIEAMKHLMPATSTVAGTIAAVLKQDAQPVEYGDRLFRVDPA